MLLHSFGGKTGLMELPILVLKCKPGFSRSDSDTTIWDPEGESTFQLKNDQTPHQMSLQ